MRRRKTREELIAVIVQAWNDMDSRDKPDFMLDHPDLYWSLSWLAARETVKREMRRR